MTDNQYNASWITTAMQTAMIAIATIAISQIVVPHYYWRATFF